MHREFWPCECAECEELRKEAREEIGRYEDFLRHVRADELAGRRWIPYGYRGGREL